MDIRLVQPENANMPIDVMVFSIFRETSFAHSLKANAPILVAAMSAEVIAVQPAKALSPMVFMLLGISTDNRQVQP